MPGSAGCFLNAPAQSRQLDEFISRGIGRRDFASTTGDPDFDRQFGRAIIRLAGFFGEQPAFGIVSDADDHDNAWAMPQTPPGAEFGTVGFGSTMLAKLRDFDPSGMAIMAIVAHEFGHIAQYRRSAIAELNQGQPNVRRSELHADYLTGCYLGWMKRNEPRISVRLAGKFMEGIGDNDVNSQHHHGTHDERIASVEAGFALAKTEDLVFEDYFSLGKAHILRTY
ncbi:MAG: hypothetical protein GC196_09755 [Hyphomonas sp.]|nr:hypothetical protein [Hyphomonas sp.]